MYIKYRLLYKPPKEQFNEDNPETWRKVFYLDKYDCLSQLDLDIHIKSLSQIYNMNPEYITIEDVEDDYKKVNFNFEPIYNRATN